MCRPHSGPPNRREISGPSLFLRRPPCSSAHGGPRISACRFLLLSPGSPRVGVRKPASLCPCVRHPFKPVPRVLPERHWPDDVTSPFGWKDTQSPAWQPGPREFGVLSLSLASTCLRPGVPAVVSLCRVPSSRGSTMTGGNGGHWIYMLLFCGL